MALPTSLSNSPDLNSGDAQLIWELVSNISPKEEVLARHGLDTKGLHARTKNPMFRSAYQEAKRLWSSDLNVQERIRLKAAYMLEDSLPDLFKIIKDDSQPGAAKLEAIEKLGKLSQVMVQKAGATGERHTIIINVGDKPTQIDYVPVAAIEAQ